LLSRRSGTDDEKVQASRILPIITRHHHLLVTLLLFNSVANEVSAQQPLLVTNIDLL
jgi:hypothetical protein